ncbi:MAG: efflux RND transporter periplasmic adaptor subunit [Epsilonproteobacteria bacterium]|nr:efflux RND transporter periplasmic adaptor subunit [Campylobacterota bacterium]
MKKYIISALVILGIAGLVYTKIYIPKHTFKITTAKTTNMPIIISGVGNVGSENIYKVSALYGGEVCDYELQLGDFVKKGQIIAKIDSVDLRDKIKEIQKNIEVIKANIASLQSDRESAYKQYIYQQEVLKKNTKLYNKRAISELEYKKYLTDTKVAKLKVSSLDEKIKSLQHQIAQLEYSLKGLNERLKRYTIISPIDGYVTKKYISNHDIVGNNQPLIEVVNKNDIWIDTFIDTRISGDVVNGNKAKIKLRSKRAFSNGYVYKISPINNAVTNEREIFVKFDKTPIPFYLNEQAIVNIKIKTLKNVLTIPASAVVFYNKKDGVWVLKNNKAHFVPIKIIAHHNNKVAVKINPQLKIIIPNPAKKPLSEGMKIYHD